MSKPTLAKGWGVYIDVIPLDDLMTHIRGEECWCGPRTDNDGYVIHNAADMREEREGLVQNKDEGKDEQAS